MDTFKFQAPFSAMVSAPTSGGKTYWCKRLIDHIDELVHPAPDEIFYCYQKYQPIYDKMKNVKFIQGLPKAEIFQNAHKSKIIFFDDLMGLYKQNELDEMSCVNSHHDNCSLVHMVQNIFNKNLRTSRINSHYIILLRNLADKLQICTLARQIFPKNQNYLLESFENATENLYGYIVIDLSPKSSSNHRLRTSIFPDDKVQYIYEVI